MLFKVVRCSKWLDNCRLLGSTGFYPQRSLQFFTLTLIQTHTLKPAIAVVWIVVDGKGTRKTTLIPKKTNKRASLALSAEMDIPGFFCLCCWLLLSTTLSADISTELKNARSRSAIVATLHGRHEVTQSANRPRFELFFSGTNYDANHVFEGSVFAEGSRLLQPSTATG